MTAIVAGDVPRLASRLSRQRPLDDNLRLTGRRSSLTGFITLTGLAQKATLDNSTTIDRGEINVVVRLSYRLLI